MLQPMRILAATMGLLLAASPVLAQSPERCADDAEGGDKKQGKFHIEIINGKPVTVIDTIVQVCGKVPRPSVVYVLTAKNIDYEWECL
jgi:hypothetical protein